MCSQPQVSDIEENSVSEESNCADLGEGLGSAGLVLQLDAKSQVPPNIEGWARILVRNVEGSDDAAELVADKFDPKFLWTM